MRIEYGFELSDVEVPRFAVEAIEGIGKLFSLATLVLNVLEKKQKVEIVFHGLNPEDPEAKIAAFREIMAGSAHQLPVEYKLGQGGHVHGSSSYFRWVTIGPR
jgi:hypothetical protein